MPTAELLKPATLTAFGRVWKRGEVEPISNELAARLEDNPRFRIRGFGNRRDNGDEDQAAARPKGAALYDAIRTAVDALDVDDESSFTLSGAPNVHAVRFALGFNISQEELDKALKASPKAEATEGDLVDEKKARGSVKIKRVPRQSDPTREKQSAADTGDAIEV